MGNHEKDNIEDFCGTANPPYNIEDFCGTANAPSVIMDNHVKDSIATIPPTLRVVENNSRDRIEPFA
ncbi:MAG TPA: hypothetical protein VJ695_08425 [Nitrososphaera sp.]|nr:hypothetical protein [Nitrososphaera sp.]